MNLVLNCITINYASFSGRARRKEYWLFFLSYIAMVAIAGMVDIWLGTAIYLDDGDMVGLHTLVSLTLLLPLLSVHIRRLHDINKSGYWWFITIIPFIGVVGSVILSCLRGTEGNNNFGPDPLNPHIKSEEERLNIVLTRLEQLERT